MDSQPFHIVKLEAADQGLDVLARFGKNVFSAEAIRDFATELIYTSKIATFFREELDLKDRDPSESLIRWILKSDNIADGIKIVNSNVVERFRPIAKSALTRVVREIVRRSITAMEEEAANTQNPIQLDVKIEQIEQKESESNDGSRGVITTDRELRAFEIAKSIFDTSEFFNTNIYDASLKKETPIEFAYKDTTGYFGIYLNKPSWWIARIVTEAKKPWIGFPLDKESLTKILPEEFQIMEASAFAETRIGISNPEDLLKLKDVFIATIKKMIEDRKNNSAAT